MGMPKEVRLQACAEVGHISLVCEAMSGQCGPERGGVELTSCWVYGTSVDDPW